MAALFNVFDTLGRYLAGVPSFMISDKSAIFLCYLRTIFIVTFLLIAFNIPPSWLFGLDADWFKVLNMCLFAFTNGFVSTLMAIKAPSKAHDD